MSPVNAVVQICCAHHTMVIHSGTLQWQSQQWRKSPAQGIQWGLQKQTYREDKTLENCKYCLESVCISKSCICSILLVVNIKLKFLWSISVPYSVNKSLLFNSYEGIMDSLKISLFWKLYSESWGWFVLDHSSGADNLLNIAMIWYVLGRCLFWRNWPIIQLISFDIYGQTIPNTCLDPH